MRPRRNAVSLATVLALSMALAPVTAATAAEQSTLQCAANVPIYRVTDTGDMYLYQHAEPENGAADWGTTSPQIGAGWRAGRNVAAPGGVTYLAWPDGALRRYHWNGSGWDTYGAGREYEVIDYGWERYTTVEYKNRITVDASGHIYTVEPDGFLHWRSYDHATRTWSHQILQDGWNQFDLIVAGGPGVLYARTPAGTLYRYRYHAASQRWLQYGKQVGTDWGIYDRVFSAGGDVLYGIRGDTNHGGEMQWHRYDENTENWTTNSPTTIGNGWFEWTATAPPDTCQRIGATEPTIPTVPTQPNGAVTLLNSSNNHVHYSYVDIQGRVIHAEATDLTGTTPVATAAIPGLIGATATTGIGEHANGLVQVVANGTDAQLRTSAQTGIAGAWDPPTSLSGYMATPTSVVRLADNTLQMYALDSDYTLWTRRQANANGPITAWIPIGGTPLAHSRLTLIPTSNGTRIIGLGRDGQFHTATYTNWTLSTWLPLGRGTLTGGTTSFTGTLSAVTTADGTLQVFATNTSGTIHTQHETSRGFPRIWTPVAGITTTGSPSAIITPNGALQIVARGTDNYVYYTSETSPGNESFMPWQPVSTSETASTDPTALAVPSSNTWVIAYLNQNNTPKLRRYEPPQATTAGTDNTEFVEIPMVQ